MDQRYYYTSGFAHKASVSVRTLRYYDKVGLLCPTSYTEGGYRLYTDEDLLRLQQILALKFLGFSLEEIRLFLQRGPQRLEEVLTRQRQMMEEKRTQLTDIIQALEQTEKLLHVGRCGWDAIVHVIQVIQMGQNNEDWVNKYFTPEQLKTMGQLTDQAYDAEAKQRLKELHPGEWTEADQKRVDEQYMFVKKELSRLVAEGADPASPEAQNVAAIKHELHFGFTKGDPLVEASLKRWWEGFQALPQEQKPLDTGPNTYTEQEQEFLNRAMEIYKNR